MCVRRHALDKIFHVAVVQVVCDNDSFEKYEFDTNIHTLYFLLSMALEDKLSCEWSDTSHGESMKNKWQWD